MTELGVSAAEAIAIGTRETAALLDLDDAGTVAVGKRADLLVVDGDPLADIRELETVDAVVKGGVRIR